MLANDLDRDGDILTVNNPAGVAATLNGNAGAVGTLPEDGEISAAVRLERDPPAVR